MAQLTVHRLDTYRKAKCGRPASTDSRNGTWTADINCPDCIEAIRKERR